MVEASEINMRNRALDRNVLNSREDDGTKIPLTTDQADSSGTVINPSKEDGNLSTIKDDLALIKADIDNLAKSLDSVGTDHLLAQVYDGADKLAVVKPFDSIGNTIPLMPVAGRLFQSDLAINLPVALATDANAYKGLYVVPVTPMTSERVEGTKISDGSFTYQHASFSVNLHVEALVGSQDFILVDLSDITNFPHPTGTGTIYIAGLHVNLNPTTAFRGDLHIGFLENVDGENGDFHTLLGWHDDQQGAEIDAEIDKVLNPFVCSSTNHLTNDISLNDTAFQTDVALSSPLDSVAAYTTVSGNGDIAVRLVRTAGTVDFDVTIQYYVV